MNENQKVEVAKLRNLGLGYKTIANKLNIPADIVKGYCRTHHLQSNDAKRCPVCGNPVIQIPHKKKRLFCSNKCRRTYWYMMKPRGICACCGKSFVPSRMNAKYCSFDCYINSRFYEGKNGQSEQV